MPRFFSSPSLSPPPLPPAQPPSDADANYPNCYLEWQSDHFGSPNRGSAKALQLLLVVSIVLLSSLAAAVGMLAWFAVGTGVIRLSTLGETAGLVGTQQSIHPAEYWD